MVLEIYFYNGYGRNNRFYSRTYYRNYLAIQSYSNYLKNLNLNNMSEVQNEYLVGGTSNFTLKAGLNQNVKVKGWSIEKNDNNGKTNTYLKLTYVHPQAGVDPEDWSTMNELLNFPGFPLNKTEVNKNTVKYGFMSPLTGFIMNFGSKDEVNERIKAVFEKLGITGFDLLDEKALHTQLEAMVRGLFDIAEKKGLFQLEGTLVCGFSAPKTDNEGNTKQYLTPAKYGAQGCYKPAFRTNNDTELPSEKTVFTDDNDKKYNYWSYTRASNKSSEPAQPAATPASEW